MTIYDTRSASPLLDLLFDDDLVGRCLVAPDGTVLRANREWLRSTGFDPDDALGANIIGLFPATRDMALAMHARARAGHRVEVPRHAQIVNGRETWWEGSIDPVPMEGGTGLLITARDAGRNAEARLDARAALLDTERRFRVAATTAQFVGAECDLDLRYVWIFNPHPDFDPTQVLGKRDDELDPSESTRRLAALKRRVIETGGTLREEITFERSNGARTYDFVLEAARDATGAIVGVTSAAFEVTDRKRTEEALRAANDRLRDTGERLRLATEAASVGIHDFDVVAGTIRWDARVRELWGVGPDEPITYDTFTAGLHPDDRTATQAAVDAALDPRGDGTFQAEYRVRSRADGCERWIAATGQVTFQGGRAVRLVGTVQDISERKRADETVASTTARLDAILNSIEDDFYVLDREWRFVFASRTFTSKIGKLPEDFVGNCIWTMFPAHLGTPFEENLRAAMERHETRRFEIPGKYTKAWYRMTVSPSRDGITVLGVDVTASRQMQEELTAINSRLVEADRRRSEFLAVLSHELRNPLAPIRNSVYLLDRAPPGSEAFGRARKVIDRQTAHLTRLVEDLIDVVRITTGRIELQRQLVDLRELVRQAMDGVRPVFEQAGVELRVDHGLGPTWLDADPTRIAQVIGNLLHNAQKFTPAGGVVTMSLASAGAHVELRVKDTGVGMEPGREHEMFEPFAQGGQGLARSKGGLGLGLSLVKLFVGLHGGTVSAKSEGKGRGTEFVITLPLADQGGPQRRGGKRSDAPARRVLVVEDNADAAQTLADVLALDGHVVRVATSGSEGVAMAREHRPDVILCDIGLPDIDGYEVARQVRAIPGLERVRLFALTGYAQAEHRERAKEAGFDGHVAKPLDPEVLARVLNGET
ncbi:MAG TPA: PAS domain S-box protein [Actinomycetota bacterium]|nr:PAS domain S-box protein [Actinomycetota bacterium]